MRERAFVLDVFLAVVASAGICSLTALAQTLPINSGDQPAPVQPIGMMQPEQQFNGGQGYQNNGGLQGQPYQGVAPAGGVCSEGWTLETNNSQTYCAPTQAKCDEQQPGSVLTNDNSGFKVCWQKINNAGGQNNGQPGGMGQNNSGQGYNNNGGPGNFNQGNNMGPGGGQQTDEQQIKNMKNEAVKLEKEYNSLKKAFDKLVAGGTILPQDVTDNLTKIKSIIDAANSGTTVEELQNVDIGEAHNIMGDLHQAQNDLMQKAQEFKNLQRNLKQMESGVKSFDRQLASLTKQKVTVPADVTDKLSQLKAKIAEIKNAKSADGLDSSTFDDLQSLMQDLNDSRDQLNMMAKWPQTIKQVTQKLKSLDKDLTRSKSIVDRLAKQGIDLSDTYAKYQTAVDGLKAAKADAETKIAAGNIEDAFTTLEDDFFNQMDNISEYQQIIQTMSNLNGFNANFNSGVKQAQSQINALKKQKVDVSELVDLLAQTKAQGAVVLAKMKEKPLDADGVLTELQTLGDLKQQFNDKVDELGGNVNGPMPWDQPGGSQQSQSLQMPQDFSNFMNNNQGNQNNGQ